MKFSKLSWIFVVCAGAVLFGMIAVGNARAQEMTYKEYEMKLAGYEKRTADTKKAIAECSQTSDQLSQEISGLNAQIASTREDLYTLVGSDEQGIAEFFDESEQIEAQLMGLMSLSEDDLFAKRREVQDIEKVLEGLKAQKIALLPDAQDKIKNIEQLIEKVRAILPVKRLVKYTVLRGDSLWRIAKKRDIYDNPYMWPRIYVENRSRIKDPDLIYPNWILNVPFGVDLNQHLVIQGQHLSSIATIVFRDASKWHKIYQANKSQILDPNLIFPAQVLDTPVN